MLLITGATGHSGQWLIKKLDKENYKGKVRCSVQANSNRHSLKNTGLDIEYVEADLRDPESAFKALEGITTVIHIVGISCSRNVIAACQKHKVEWAILVHTTGRYSMFKSAAQEYIENEDWVLRSGVLCTILRPTMIYGSRSDRNMWKLIDFLNRHKFFPLFGAGKNLMQPIHAKDVGEALYSILINKEKTIQRQYNIAGKEPISYFDLVRTIAQTLNRNVFIVKIPYFLSIWGAYVLSLFSKNPIISVEQVMRMKEDKAFDYSEATKDFGYSPMDFEQGIRGEVESYLSLTS